MRKLSLLILCFLFFMVTKTILAQDLEFSCDESACSASSPIPLFSSSFVWYPGESVSKVIRIRNNSKTSQIIGAKAENESVTGRLNDVISLSVVKISTNTQIWSGSLNDFYNSGDINLITLLPNTFEDFVYTVSMSQTADNSYQSKKTEFDLVIGFLQVPTNTPGPTNTPTPAVNTTTTAATTSSLSVITPIFEASSLTQKVLGKATAEAQLADIKNKPVQLNKTLPPYLIYLWLVLIILILLLLLYIYLRKKNKRK